jgi:membrane protease YdiL (CAAX protease family)
LACVGANSTRIPLGLPFGSFVPYSALIALFVAIVYGGDEARFGAGWVDKAEGGALSVAVALVGAVLFSAAIVAWSVFWVKGEHGPIQASMGPTMSPMRIVIYSIINGIGEELEFRMLLLGGLVARPATHETAWLCLALALQAAYFASLHFSRGFPSGYSGVLLLFVWAFFLGVLRLWTGSFVLPILSHIQLDIVVFALIYIEEQRRSQQKLTRGATAARGAAAASASTAPMTHGRGASKVD